MKKLVIYSSIIIFLAIFIGILLHGKNTRENTRQTEVGKLINRVVDRVVGDYYPYNDATIPAPTNLIVWYDSAEGHVNYSWNSENCLTEKALANTRGLNFPVNAHNQAEVFSWVKPGVELFVSRIEVQEGIKAYVYLTKTCAGEKYFETIYLARSCPEDDWKISSKERDKEI